ncbi:Scr1 family TA system antitoxin-like transcriptional regulator [Actinoallomurus acaciae]|uniref:Scr1 family TA system antitoxin-like transcriptional regulator n=1 Tax=Actinoallomurus acaciae TaxID=502577 RepID=A0ABV5YGK3_9ACTN
MVIPLTEFKPSGGGDGLVGTHGTRRIGAYSCEFGGLGLDGPFKVVTVREGTVAYLDALNDGRLASDTSEVAELDAGFHWIGAVAEPLESSRRLVREVMETFT